MRVLLKTAIFTKWPNFFLYGPRFLLSLSEITFKELVIFVSLPGMDHVNPLLLLCS
jgi:hypothetical protein